MAHAAASPKPPIAGYYPRIIDDKLWHDVQARETRSKQRLGRAGMSAGWSDWARTLRWGSDPVEYDDAWREKSIETLKNRIIQSGLASAFTMKLDPMMEALSRIGPNLPANLASEVGAEICKWVLEQHNDAMELEIGMDALRRAAIGDAKLLHDF